MRGRSVPKLLGAVLEAADQERQAEHEQDVGQDRADDRRAHDVVRARRAARRADEQLRQVAQRGLHHAGRAGAEPVAERSTLRPTRLGQRGERSPATTNGTTVPPVPV